MAVLRRGRPVEIVVTVAPICGRSWEEGVTAAAAAVDALLSPTVLRGRGFQLLAVEGLEPYEPAG